jgi:hypothetical protein
MASIAAAIDQAYSRFSTVMSNSLIFDTIEFYNVTQDLPMGEVAWPVQVGGGDATDGLPPQIAAQINFVTGLPRSQGRKYFGCFTEQHSEDDGYVSSSLLAWLALAAADLLLGAVSGGTTWSIGHYKVSTSTFIQWLSAIVPIVFATQRRRKAGVGS